MRLWRQRRRPRRPRTAAVAAAVQRASSRALLEFGASGARAALVRLAGGTAEVLAVGQASGPGGIARPGAVAHYERLTHLAERALSSAEHLAAGIEILPVIADEAIVGLNGPMLDAELTAMHFPRRRPQEPVSDRELATAMLRTQRRALSTLADRAAASRIRYRLVSAQLVGAVVDGERLRAPYDRDLFRPYTGPRGETLSLAICNIIWPLSGLEIIERVLVALELEGRGVVPLAQAVAAAAPLADTILIDVGHEYTEVALAEGGVLSHFRTFPLGGLHFTETLVRTLYLTAKAAELAKQRYSQGHGSADARARMGAALRPRAHEWRASVEQALLHLAGSAPLPAHIFLYGGGSAIPDLVAELRSQPWTRRLPFERHPEVELLTPQRLRGVHDPAGRLQGCGGSAAGTAVGLAALGAWAVHEPSAADRLLSDVSRRVAANVGLL
ncbi:MAG: cell division FtsA domain-containing protein [Ardenticatenaceae bacterium]|nr:cell division FtsA domain-containing protein [Ardenticatenaceae bacterium]